MAKFKPFLTKNEISLIDELKNLRIKKKISQTNLAEKAGVSRVSIADLENHYKKPREQFISKIAAALEYPGSKLEVFLENTGLNKIIFQEKILPIPLSNHIINSKKELDKLNLSSSIFLPYHLIEYISSFQSKFYAYIMPDEAMSPVIKKNDVVLIKHSNISFKDMEYKEITDPLFIAAVNAKTGQEVIRRYNENFLKYFSDVPKGIEEITLLKPENPEYKIIPIKDISKTDWKIKGLIIAVISERIFVDPHKEQTEEIKKIFDL